MQACVNPDRRWRRNKRAVGVFKQTTKGRGRGVRAAGCRWNYHPSHRCDAGPDTWRVYRRFRNKDVLLETAILRILEDQDKFLLLSLTVEAAAEIPFPTLAEQVINSLVVSYRANASLLRAVRQFLQKKRPPPFRSRPRGPPDPGRLNI